METGESSFNQIRFKNAGISGKRRVQGFCGGNTGERERCGDPGVDGRIILRLIFSK
jgi:hypothetical protein